MKKLLNLALLGTALALFPMTTAMTCTPSQQRITYTSLYGIGTAVNGAYAAYMDKVVAGKAPLNQAVVVAYNDFQLAFATAVQAAQMNTAAVAPQPLVDKSNALIAQIPK